MRARPLCLLPIAALLLFGASLGLVRPVGRAHPPVVRYRVTDLGTLPGFEGASATAINSNGWVVGHAFNEIRGGADTGPPPHGFLWHDGKMIQLRTLGGYFCSAESINLSNKIVGGADTQNAQVPVMWRGEDPSKPTALSNRPGQAASINDNDDIAGWTTVGRGDDERSQAAVWRDGNRIDLPYPDKTNTYAQGINNRGDVIGNAGHLGSTYRNTHAVLWRKGI